MRALNAVIVYLPVSESPTVLTSDLQFDGNDGADVGTRGELASVEVAIDASTGFCDFHSCEGRTRLSFNRWE
jgi:hypothetical protein